MSMYLCKSNLHIPIGPAIHGKSGKLSGVFVNMVVFTIAIAHECFDMQINRDISRWVYRHHNRLIGFFGMHHMTFSFKNALGKNQHASDKRIIGCR